ncbi:hypothetical protein [Streptomyces sp. Ncost-T10-10d]|uniref:hypothetical protein n=1 Tax=Streptomyces sp. Ncost-T10-10d TaxID=1839774 RepID=UPI00081EE4BC|nr:hypothetical protein [Streptomyces sp. Ncost-T10-10d]SCF73801.1 hypothetical protein GA0115254_11477 [Streptomyces sp. Ncost-T10-10d]
MVVMGAVVTAAAALAAGYLLGRLRPWRRAGDWAADQVRFTGPWVQGGFGRQAVVVLDPRSHRAAHQLAHHARPRHAVPAPGREPGWIANRSRREHE